MFIHTDSSVKEKHREKLKNYILDNVGIPESMLTLSADNFLFESKFPEVQITSCEFDKQTYRNAIKNKPNNVNLINKDIFYEKPSYEVIWLDLCINLSVKTINQLISYLQESKASLVSITVQAQREHLSKHLHIYKADSIEDFRVNVFPRLIYAMTGYKLVKLDRYRTHINMSMYTFKKPTNL